MKRQEHNRYRAAWSRLSAVGSVLAMLGGCTHPGASTHVTGPAATDAPDGKPRGLDLSRNFKFNEGVGISTLAPLSFSKQLAQSGGGAWVVLAAKPLEDVKLTANSSGMRSGPPPSATIQETLETIRKAGTPVEWDTSKGYMLLDYGPPHDIDRVRAAPPAETVGVLLSAETVPDLLKAVGDVWHVTITAPPELVAKIEAYNTAHRTASKIMREAVAEWTKQAYSGYGRYGQDEDGADPGHEHPHPVEFHALKRLDFDGLLHGLAQTLGAEARDLGNNKWQIAAITDQARMQAEMTRLKAVIDEALGNTAGSFTSFASRSGQEAGSVADSQPVPIPEVSEDASVAFECLGRFGKAAIPTLVAYLDPEKPMAAKPAAETLYAMATVDKNQAAAAALVDFTNKLRTPCKDKTANMMRPEILDLMIHVIANDAAGNRQIQNLLAEIALDQKANQDVRIAARMAAVQNGGTSSFAGPTNREMGAGEMDHVVLYPPEPGRPQPIQSAPDSGTIVPLANTRTPAGDVWAVFLSGRLGNTNDLWLAHGSNHKWTEFIFTGKLFTRQNGYNGYGNGAPTKGSCALTADGDNITIKPPNMSLVSEVARLTTLLQDPKLTPEKRNALSMQYQRAAQQSANVLDKPIPLSLKELRKDSDGDGLPDLVEKRLGLDPNNADTDKDGIKDGVDANPLVGADSAKTGRGKILQMVFEALYGKDMSPDPILVVLDRAYWQEFYGSRARVICITHHDLIANATHLSSLRILEFGGPNDASATILQKDGPALFNDNHTRSEVHFWQWKGSNSVDAARQAMRRQYGQTAETPQEYIAQFDNGPNWKMTSLRPSKADTADKSAEELTGAISAGIYGRVE